jgi:hypothetical protein
VALESKFVLSNGPKGILLHYGANRLVGDAAILGDPSHAFAPALTAVPARGPLIRWNTMIGEMEEEFLNRGRHPKFNMVHIPTHVASSLSIHVTEGWVS